MAPGSAPRKLASRKGEHDAPRCASATERKAQKRSTGERPTEEKPTGASRKSSSPVPPPLPKTPTPTMFARREQNDSKTAKATTTTTAKDDTLTVVPISIGTRVEIVFGKRLGQVGRVVRQGKLSGRWRVRVESKKNQSVVVVEYPSSKLRPLSHGAIGVVSSPIVRASPSPSRRGTSARRRKVGVRSVRPKTPTWLLRDMSRQA